MPHLQSASLGVWAAAAAATSSRRARHLASARAHGLQGDEDRTARQIAEEIRGGRRRLNARPSFESTAYYARVLRADVPLALDVLSDILTNPDFEPEEARAREKW
jgi:predicted Zn-dependent peptidase